MAPKQFYKQEDLNSSVLNRFLNVENVSAERVWTPREFQTVGAAAQNALGANDNIVVGCCCRRRAKVERRVRDGWYNRGFTL